MTKNVVITRKKSGEDHVYFKGQTQLSNRSEIERIKKLAIPPAWRHVEISPDPKSKVQATGRDGAGRRQAIYSEAHRKKSDRKKFTRTLEFARKLPALRRQLEKDLRKRSLSKQKVLATIVMLIHRAYFRIGSEVYAREHHTYGVTTLRSKHVDVTTTSVTFDFTGKSGKHHHKTIKDRTLARIIKQLDELPGYDLFRYLDEQGNAIPINAADVNEYIKQYMGDDFTAKDFRTWGGTMLAVSNLALSERIDSPRELKKNVTKAVKIVAKKLGNTPAVARSSYIDPSVFELYLGGNAIANVYETIKSMKPKKYMKTEEQAVMTLLEKR